MKELLTHLCNRLENGRPAVLASVVAQHGSTPRRAGSKLLADHGGLVAGTVGGGLLEGETLKACRAALEDGTARLLDFELNGEAAAKDGLICGGGLRVLIEPLSAAQLPFFQGVREALRAGGVTLITDLTNESRPRRTARAGHKLFGAPLPEDAIAELQAALGPAEAALLRSHGRRTYFVERCRPPLRLVIVGGGHVSRPTAQVAALAGFEVSVLDDRPEFSSPERFPWAARVATSPGYRDCFASLAPDSRTYIVIVTRGHLHDAAVLSQALATGAAYIGMIGSRRKRDELYAALRAQGTDEDALARVHCPIGLDIGAETPEEIAVSIVAECVRHRRRSCPRVNTPR